MRDMTREEAIEVLDDMKVKIDIPKSAVTQHKRNEALDMAISAISAEGDLISRQAVLNTLENADKFLDEDRTVENYKELLTECIKVLTSVENKGKWEKIWRTDCERSEYVCSKCGCGEDYQTDFCPNCGADMRGK